MNRYTAIFSLLVALLIVTDVKAFTVSPIGYRSTIEPGSHQTFNIAVTNNESGARRYKVSVESVRNTEDGRRYYESGADPAEFWASMAPDSFSLSPGDQKTVVINMSVPKNALPGSHPLAVMVASENTSRGEIGLTARSAVPISLIVAGEVTERLKLKKFIAHDGATGKKFWNFDIELYNEGTMDVQASGWIEIRNAFGKKIYDQPLTLGSAIYPRSERRLSPSLEIPPGIWPGKYTVKFIAQYGALKNTVTGETSLWYLPVYLAEAGIVLIFIFIIWLWRRRKVCP